MHPRRGSAADFIQGERGIKFFCSFCLDFLIVFLIVFIVVVYNLLTKGGKKGQRGSLAWSSVHCLNVKPEDYVC